MKKGLKISIGVISLMVILLVVSCKSENNDQEEQASDNGIVLTQNQFDQANMESGYPEERQFTEAVFCNGYVVAKASDMAKVSSPVSGVVKSINYVHNQHVVKGEVLMVIDGPQFIKLQQSFFEAKAKYMVAKESYERGKLLYDEKIKSKKEISIIESNYLSAKAGYNSLLIQLKQLGIDTDIIEDGNFFETFQLRAPISGYILRSNVVIGESFDSNEELCEIINPEDLHVDLQVFESDFTLVKVGQNVEYTALGLDGKSCKGNIISIGTAIDDETKTLTCIGSIDNDEHQIVGTFVEAEILTSIHKGIGLPDEALVKSGNEYFVFSINEKGNGDFLVIPIKVKTGSKFNGFTEIITPLDNKNVILKGAFQLPIEF